MSIVYLNGEFIPAHEAKISVFDRGFLFADSVYEVIPIHNGRLFQLDEHLDRLYKSLKAIYIDPNLLTRSILKNILAQLLEKNTVAAQSIYLQVTRGAEEQRHHNFSQQLTPTVFATVLPARPLTEKQPSGIQVITTHDFRWERCDIKSTSLLANIMMMHMAEQHRCPEIILERNGFITEGASSNVFVIKANKILTPPKSQYILGGTVRDSIVSLALRHNIPCNEQEIPFTDLYTADEVWITSSTRKIIPVIKIDEAIIGDGKPGPLWRTMIKLYDEYIQALK